MNAPCSVLPLCLFCSTPLDVTDAACVCKSCGHCYPITLGIVDLRHPHQVQKTYSQTEAELLSCYPDCTYEELREIYFRNFDWKPYSNHMRERFQRYWYDQVERGKQFACMFLSKSHQIFGDFPKSVALEIGCGSGGALVTLAQEFDCVIGIEPELSLVLLARKFLEEKRVSNVMLIQAYGQSIPFASDSIDFIMAQNAMDHIIDVETVISEIIRVLHPGGRFSADSRNRFELLLPEPHTGLRWLGFLPRRWVKDYVRLRTGGEYEHTHLLSYTDLHRALKGPFGAANFQILFPDVTPYGYPQRYNDLLQKLAGNKILYRLALWFFPSHLVLAMKPRTN